MIEIAKGNLLQMDAAALVNTVNCEGFMGKGIALQFKKACPDNFKAYQRGCRAKDVQPGRMFVFPTSSLVNPKFIINFPTKRHWRGRSRIEDIRTGLDALVQEILRLQIPSVALPPLGCGLGGLTWFEVKPMIEKAFAPLPEIRVFLFEPAGTPEARSMPVGTHRPGLTAARAILIMLMKQYTSSAYRLTLLEVQKLAYFLQESGEPLRLRYEAGHYGPYAANLNKVLETLEGHFTRGYGDCQKPDVEIELLPQADLEAAAFLSGRRDSIRRLEQVADLIDGFETPYGMELLASLHWVAKHLQPRAANIDLVSEAVRQWNERKRKMFQPDHIMVAWGRMVEKGWLAGLVQGNSG